MNQLNEFSDVDKLERVEGLDGQGEKINSKLRLNFLKFLE